MTLSPEAIDTPDAERARNAFTALLAESEALHRDALLTPSMNVPYLLVEVRRLLREWRGPDTLARLDRVPAASFDRASFDRVESCVEALWHADTERLRASALESKRKVDATVGREAIALRRRMVAAARYHLGDAPEVGGALRVVRGKRSWMDLAMDLTHLAAIFEAHAGRWPQEPDRGFDGSEVARAQRLVPLLHRDLAARVSRANPWSETVARVFTLLARDYEALRHTVAWAWRDARPEGSFPRLRQLRPRIRGVTRPRPGAT